MKIQGVPFVNIHRLPPLCPTAASGISDVLRQVNVPVMTNNDCDSVYGIVGDGVVCIDGTGGKSTCNVSEFGAMLSRDMAAIPFVSLSSLTLAPSTG